MLAGIFSIAAQTSDNISMATQGATCTSIPGIGAPVLILRAAKQYLTDALSLQSQNTVVRYLYYAMVPPSTISTASSTVIYPQPTNTAASTQMQPNLATIYRVVFSISDYNGSKYVGVELAVSPFGIGGVKINRFLLTGSLSLIKSTFDQNITDGASINCGDLKLIYSSGSAAQNIDNVNTVGLDILNSQAPVSTSQGSNNNSQLNATGTSTSANKICASANFIETAGFFGSAGNNATTGVDLINCVPNKNSVAAIMVGCTNNTVSSLQLLFNNYSDAGVRLSAFAGNPSTPASNVTTISLGNADRISLVSTNTPPSIKIQTLDTNNATLTVYNCGNGTASPQTVVVSAMDFLGLTNVIANGNISAFQVTQYKANN